MAMGETVLKVLGMTCSGCEASVVRAVSALPGVRSVRADHRAREVRVEADPGVDRGAIAARVEAAGFQVVPAE